MSLVCSDPTLTGLSSGKEGTYTMKCYISFQTPYYIYRADSGFKHVEPEKYTPRLLHIKGKKVYTSIELLKGHSTY